jgi:molybdate transport system ATP-binding protein
MTGAASLSVHVVVEPQEPQEPELDVAFDVPPGITVLFGPSGAGKSRTLAGIAGILRPSRGRVALGDDVWFDGTGSSRVDVPIHDRRIAYLFQSLALFPHLTAVENVAYGISRTVPTEERRSRAMDILEKMHVKRLADRRPRTFSGGEAQRVALARAFAMAPRVVLLDEPFNALDAGLKTELLREVGALLARENVPTVLVTHQSEDAEVLGDRVVFLAKGRVVRTSSIADRPFR